MNEDEKRLDGLLIKRMKGEIKLVVIEQETEKFMYY